MRTKLTTTTIPGQKEAYLVETIGGDMLGTIARYNSKAAWSVTAGTGHTGKYIGTCYSKEGAKFMLIEATR